MLRVVDNNVHVGVTYKDYPKRPYTIIVRNSSTMCKFNTMYTLQKLTSKFNSVIFKCVKIKYLLLT